MTQMIQIKEDDCTTHASVKQKVSNYDQEIPQSHKEDHSMVPRGRVTEY